MTVNFFYGDFGLGSAYIPIGSESVSFTAGDMTQTVMIGFGAPCPGQGPPLEPTDI